MNNLSLTKRIGIAFAAVILIFTGLGLITLARFTSVHTETQRVTDKCLPGILAISQVSEVALGNLIEVMAHVASTNLEENAGNGHGNGRRRPASVV